MFNPEKIKEIAKVSKAEKWPFPKILTAWKEAGVEEYAVDLSRGTITYYSNGSELTDGDVPALKNLPDCGRFDPNALKEAIHVHQVKRTSYTEVIQEIVKAGVAHYRVDVIARTCTYFGKNPGEEHVETFPA